MDTIEFSPGTHIERAAKELCAAAIQSGRTVAARFNDIELTARPNEGHAEVASRYYRAAEERAAAYRASPEGKEQEVRRERERAHLQSEHDTLVATLPRLDFTNRVAVLDWLCALQPATDRLGVTIEREKIVAKFEAEGFEAGANCGPDYRDDDSDNTFRYLVGQALDGLKNGPAIHGILHKFVAEWKAKFAAQEE